MKFSAFLARSSLSIKSYLIQKKELQECRLTLLASYKSIIGIILFNLSTTISLKKIFFHIFLALKLHLLFLIDFDCQTLHTVLTPGISLIKEDIEVYVNENVLDNLSRQWQKFDQLRPYKPRKSLFAETPTMVIVLEMGSRQITHIPVLICRDSYKGRTGAWQITLTINH